MHTYLKITERCNMNCKHCMFSCTEYGADMSFDTFKRAVELGKNSRITLGGGEPTLHPLFEFFALHLLSRNLSFGVVTNGTDYSRSKLLFDLSKKTSGKVSAKLSLDAFHDETMVSDEIIDLFTENNMVRDNSNSVVKLGRGQKTGCYKAEHYCTGLIYEPNGNIRLCACEDSPVIGDVWCDIYDEFKPLVFEGEYRCCKQFQKQMKITG